MVLSFAVARVRAPGLMEPGLFLQPAPMEDVNALVERFLSGAWPARASRLEFCCSADKTARHAPWWSRAATGLPGAVSARETWHRLTPCCGPRRGLQTTGQGRPR